MTDHTLQADARWLRNLVELRFRKERGDIADRLEYIAGTLEALSHKPSEDDVERVARALYVEALACGEAGSRRVWDKITDEERNGFLRLARAAINAMQS